MHSAAQQSFLPRGRNVQIDRFWRLGYFRFKYTVVVVFNIVKK